MGHSLNLVADDLARQVKKHRDKRRGRREAQQARGAGTRCVGGSQGAPLRLPPCYRCSDMSILDRALRVGEGKKFKAFETNVELINAFEPELELESDEELRERYAGAARAAPERRVARRPAVRVLRAHARGRQARARPAPLRRPADRRHGPPRRLDRRDEDRRGQDAHRHAAGGPERARLARRERLRRARARASTSSRSTTTWPAATPCG